MNEGIPPEASVALVFNQQAINILGVKNDYPHKRELQTAAAEHLLRVFTAPPPPPAPSS